MSPFIVSGLLCAGLAWAGASPDFDQGFDAGRFVPRASEKAGLPSPAGAGVPILERDVPELVEPGQLAKVWGFVKQLAGAPEDLPPPRIRFESFDPARMSTETKAWIEEWGKKHPDQPLPFDKGSQGFYFVGTGTAQVDPAVFRRGYQLDPVSGRPRDYAGLGYYSVGHEMLHYAFEAKGVPIEKHHCAFLKGGDSCISERLAASLSEAGLSNLVLIRLKAISAERQLNRCEGDQ